MWIYCVFDEMRWSRCNADLFPGLETLSPLLQLLVVLLVYRLQTQRLVLDQQVTFLILQETHRSANTDTLYVNEDWEIFMFILVCAAHFLKICCMIIWKQMSPSGSVRYCGQTRSYSNRIFCDINLKFGARPLLVYWFSSSFRVKLVLENNYFSS